jgi:hypothetical protein
LDLHVLSTSNLPSYVPSKRTYLLNIVSTKDEHDLSSTSAVHDLQRINHPNYAQRQVIGIDDAWEPYLPSGNPVFDIEEVLSLIPQYEAMGMTRYIDKGCKLFDLDVASNLLEHFKEHRNGLDSLVVTCHRGINRSPAVAMALNQIYKLGHNHEELIQTHPQANWYVYKVLLEAAAKNPELVR